MSLYAGEGAKREVDFLAGFNRYAVHFVDVLHCFVAIFCPVLCDEAIVVFQAL